MQLARPDQQLTDDSAIGSTSHRSLPTAFFSACFLLSPTGATTSRLCGDSASSRADDCPVCGFVASWHQGLGPGFPGRAAAKAKFLTVAQPATPCAPYSVLRLHSFGQLFREPLVSPVYRPCDAALISLPTGNYCTPRQ
ncbi:hypothetical protein HDV57DRAFT_201673 [Trichoderma longibrachiatum]